MVKTIFFDAIGTQSAFSCLIKHIENKKTTVFAKVSDVPDISDFPKNSDFGQFLSRYSRSGNIFHAFKLNDTASAILYLSFTTKIKALPVLVLKI